MLSDKITIYTDGGSRNNPGQAACAFVVIDEKGQVIHQDSKHLGVATNNIAEYEGVILAIIWLQSHLTKFQNIVFRLDSQLVVNQLNGVYKIKDLNLKQKADQIKDRLKVFSLSNIKFMYIPRSDNFRADFLVNQRLDQN
jgi:ribonuclease HI